MAASYPPTHAAVVTFSKRAPLSILDVPTAPPEPGEVIVKVQWTASSPAELHQADGDLINGYPFILGCSFAGTIVALGPEDPNAVPSQSSLLAVGDRVTGFASSQQKQNGFQEYVTVPRNLLGRIPENLSMESAVTVPVNLVTAFHAITHSLGLDLPWPLPSNYVPEKADVPILVWGAAGSVGNYAIQLLRLWGYRNVLGVARKKHHLDLARLGCRQLFDYTESSVTEQISAAAEHIPYILDCIGHVDGTLRPLSKIAGAGSTLAVVVPIIIRHATSDVAPQLSLDPSTILVSEWVGGVQIVPIMAFFYEQNEFLKWHLQPDIIPALLEHGSIRPNRLRIVEGESLLSRAMQALTLLRDRVPSGERLVWRVSDS
ncbi:hypothetical protein BDV24DRAFT_177973 [Aspergillus arachidicola]|uniref:Enoyl reductase (ER) domain-containing protein n=1 Tax=Aspergillus arachidicola TaxID=656916 RepID=A0A5N6XXQ5_9EURO|nr:hypothetical protein BDV24DRAFT_177973 [Aspergillus arachidicola]